MSKILLNKLEVLMNTGELLTIVDSCKSNSQVLLKLGYSRKGQYIPLIKDFLYKNDVSTTHFTCTGKDLLCMILNICANCGKEFKTLNSARKQTTCSHSCSNSYFRSGKDNPNWRNGIGSYRKVALDYYNNSCSLCGYNNTIALEVHHIDKDRKNNDITNLQILCANCHIIMHNTT